jgi:hypothetical protein
MTVSTSIESVKIRARKIRSHWPRMTLDTGNAVDHLV